ncbi:glycosyltransferase family 2 protein [Exiguobacterium acetylicum]|uniref:glycosyltransferase family 2 protein n=1 Tax=Exiguobacterium acetylicum TaxID=41170 RepID=UPI001CA7222B|nr:glycosyltransferase family 2 protein [Exiguobacterium acetylicum]QZY86248.1 glycosyltransferase family 2 protein [Exiguobacterium acetylicum]
MKKVLIGSPIHQDPEILKYFLDSLLLLNTLNVEVHYLFIDDNKDLNSKEILKDFSENQSNVVIYESLDEDEYIKNEETHFWNEKLIWKVAHYKNIILKMGEEYLFDYVFLVDSDLLLHRETLNELISSKKDIISNIFWTKWQPHFPELPQVWMFDQYEQYEKKRWEDLSNEEIVIRRNEFIGKMRIPGVYRVGGLGACTLISKKAISDGVNFSEISNLSLWGEDRHFCVRAESLGYKLFVNTVYPSLHLYRLSDLKTKKIKEAIKEISYDFFNLKRTITIGLKNLGTFDFKEGYINEWKSYFTKDFTEIIEGAITEQANHMRIKEINVKAKIYILNIDKITKEYSQASILINNKIVTKENEEEESNLFKVELENKKDKWKISNLEFMSRIK